MEFYKRFGKRAFDLFFSITGSLFLFLPSLIVYLAIVYREGRPGFFIQTRIGKKGRPFKIVKFRTMSLNRQENTVTAANDSRITPIGKFLRSTKIDEWPQLINIIKGDMSFVGPRPDVPGFADKLQGSDRRMLNLRPGITGFATIAYRHEEELLSQQEDPIAYNQNVIWPDKVKINLEYEARQSMIVDLNLIIRTIINK